MDEVEAVEGVLVLAARTDGPLLLIDVYGGSEPVCATVTYRIPDLGERLRQLEIASWWRDHGTPLTLLTRADGFTALFDGVGALAALLDELDDELDGEQDGDELGDAGQARLDDRG